MSAMFGKKVKEYVRFERWILILIVVVFALRLGLSLAGVSKAEYPVMTRTGIPTIPKATEWVSINLILLVGILYCAIAVQTRGAFPPANPQWLPESIRRRLLRGIDD